MELTVRKDELAKGLSKSQSVVERRTSMPILSNVLLEAEDERLLVAATDLETSFKGQFSARVSKPGKVTVPARKFYEIIKELPAEEIYLKEKENNFLHISAGRASFDLVGLSAEDFPNLPQVAGVPQLGISGEILSEMIEKTIFSISQEDTRFNLAGLFVQKRTSDGDNYLRFVSTDGHRLSLVDRSLEGLDEFELDGGVIIPRKGVAEMRKMAEEEELQLGLSQNYATLTVGEARLILRMQEGSFPDYEVVIPKVTKKKAVVNRQAFSDVLRRVAILATDRFQGVKLDFKEGLLGGGEPEPGPGRGPRGPGGGLRWRRPWRGLQCPVLHGALRGHEERGDHPGPGGRAAPLHDHRRGGPGLPQRDNAHAPVALWKDDEKGGSPRRDPPFLVVGWFAGGLILIKTCCKQAFWVLCSVRLPESHKLFDWVGNHEKIFDRFAVPLRIDAGRHGTGLLRVQQHQSNNARLRWHLRPLPESHRQFRPKGLLPRRRQGLQ